jgi:hypothetical protein
MHPFKSRPGYRGSGPCGECGYTAHNERQHGHSCTGKVIFNHNSDTLMHCYECGKQYRYGGLALVRR